MSEKSDDIKQLFSHLGLNPSDYQEIRSAPSSGATMTEAPRRWSLLQAINTQAPPPTSPRTAPSLVPPAAPAQATPSTPSQWAEILPGLAPSAPLANPSIAAAPLAEPSPADSLNSLFQSVRETPAPPVLQPEEPMLTGEQAADQLYRELRSSAQALAGRSPPPPPVTPPWAGYDPELETRHAEVPQVPVRVAAPAPAPLAPATETAPRPPTRLVMPIDRPDPIPAAIPPPVAPAAPRMAARPAAAVPPPRVAVTPNAPPAPRVAVNAAPAPSTGLQAAFRRLSEPEPPRSVASGKLRLNYQLPHTSSAAANKDERLGDVLKRISGHNGSSR